MFKLITESLCSMAEELVYQPSLKQSRSWSIGTDVRLINKYGKRYHGNLYGCKHKVIGNCDG